MVDFLIGAFAIFLMMRRLKRGPFLELHARTDGQTSTPITALAPERGPSDNRIYWGNAEAKYIGIYADSGTALGSPRVNAAFDFFEAKARQQEPVTQVGVGERRCAWRAPAIDERNELSQPGTNPRYRPTTWAQPATVVREAVFIETWGNPNGASLWPETHNVFASTGLVPSAQRNPRRNTDSEVNFGVSPSFHQSPILYRRYRSEGRLPA